MEALLSLKYFPYIDNIIAILSGGAIEGELDEAKVEANVQKHR